ncbi:uncharacterized protein LOC142343002 [Convolutriloba macropyga]|uniref:uncharacterized protein LOC142343002 n=1 Tax=Convolutriloba macropyga TaxID=536237 RepID=UPI003F526CF7
MVDTRSTANSESDQRETTILGNLHQCSSAPTESLSEEKPETLQEQKMLESSKMMITDDIHYHLDYLNSSIDESEDVDILQEIVEEIKEKQRKLETVVSQLIILIDPSEQSNCSREHSRLKIEVKKCIDNFKKYVKGKSQINTGEDFSLSVGAIKRPNCPPDSSNFQFSNPVQPGLDISNQEQYAVSSSAPVVNNNVSFSAPSSLLFDANAAPSSMLNAHSFNWPTQSIFPETNRNASSNNFDHRGLLNAESSNQCSTSSMSVCFQKSVPKLHAETFNGDPMKWIKWYSIFKATIDQSPMSSAEKMIHLQSLLTVCFDIKPIDSSIEPVRLNDVMAVPDLNMSAVNVAQLNALCQNYDHLSHKNFPELERNNVSIIIGIDNLDLIHYKQIIKGPKNAPWGVETPLGWTCAGKTNLVLNESTQVQYTQVQNCPNMDDSLFKLVQDRMKVENWGIASPRKALSENDKRAIEILESTTKIVDGHYQIGLLWKQDNVSFLPHHPVTNENKPGKVRRVANAASIFQGQSLNSNLLKGPDLLSNLTGVIMRFRENRIALCADIEQMFMQVKVDPTDRPYLRFLWKKNGRIETYEYTSHIFGATDSPCIASYALRRSAQDNAKTYPSVQKVIERNIYMDDLYVAVSSPNEASNIVHETRKVLATGGFNLTKWNSNSQQVLDLLNPDIRLNPETSAPQSQKVLGLPWFPEADTFVIEQKLFHKIKLDEKTSQRKLLRFVASIFDPLGIIAPFTIRFRNVLQAAWNHGPKWDKPLQIDENSDFENLKKELSSFKDVHLPRKLLNEIPISSIELHTFTDASELALSAVSYLRIEHIDESVSVAFVIGKARVAPIKRMTIPNLELQAAVYGAQLAQFVRDEMDIEIHKQVFWSDSTTVLYWLRTPEIRHRIFIANRLAKILDVSSAQDWFYISSTRNPADDGTRGYIVQQMNVNSLSSTSRIVSLSPYVDHNQHLRARGRLSKALRLDTARFPLILDGNNQSVEIEWVFNPPAAPHFGGSWERLVQIFKLSLYKVIGSRTLSDDILWTLVCEIESNMNSRPLTNVPSEINDPLPLTPNHFLLGRASLNYPPGLFESQKVTVSRSWKSAQELASHFWNRFLREYIPNQQTRSKWNGTSENLKVNDLVWLLEDFTPRGLWPLAKVIEIYPGSDGVVRSVKLRTPHGEKVRPVIKLSKVLINK